MRNLLHRFWSVAAFILFFSVSFLQIKAQNNIYYNAGGAQYISLAGDTFKVDLNYTPGATATYTNPTANLAIANTDDDVLYRSERSANVNGGSFGYNIPVQNGLYKIRLHFAEIFYGATGGNLTPPFTGKRVFDVSIEGILVLDNYDINVEVGPMAAVIKEYDSVAVNDANIDIDFASVTNKAKISAISIIPISIIPSSNTPPTFLTSGNVTVDEDFAGTQTVTVTPNPVPPADAGQTVTYSLNPPSVAFANVSINTSTGLVSITKVTNKNGAQLFTITANDGQPANNIATQNFTLTVNAVNDAPAFTTSGNITTNENFAGTQTVTVTPAAVPADEAGQTVTYSLNPPSVAFANVSINTSTGLVSITSVPNAFGSQLFTITANDGQGLNNTATQNFTLTVNDTTVTPTVQDALYYNCGGPQYISLAGDTFVPDLHFSSGTTVSSNNIVPDIFGTSDDILYRTERFKNDFTYNIPVQNGAYTVKLHFAEIFYGVAGGNITPPFTGKRVFHVVLEGDSVLKNYDINADVGPGTAVIKQYDNVQINDGTVTINLKGVVNNAKISAISIEPATGTPNNPPTVSITAPNEGASFIEATAIQINASADDTDGTISKVEFYQNGNLLNTDFSFPYSFTWNNATPGGKALTAKAFDDDNASTTSAPVNIIVTADAAPSVSITSPANGANFTAGASIQINASATDDLAVTNVEFYEGVNLLGSDNSFPYSFNWNNPAIGNYSLTAKAFDNNLQSTTSSTITVEVLADAPPTVSITSPADGAIFTAGQTIIINATATDDIGIAQVDFYAGATFLGSDNSFPYSFSWTNVQEGNYALTATAFDTQFQGTISNVVNITVDTIPVGDLEALLVVGNLSLNNGDQALKTRLETLGFNVTVVVASSSVTADATGKNLVFISSTVNAANVGTKFTSVTVPVINCEQALHDDLGMTSSASGNSGSTANQTQINIIGAGHPLAAALPNAPVTIYTSAQAITWGKPSVNAVKIATTMSSSAQISIFGYESGAAMVSGNAPARRVGFFLQDAGAAFLTASGTALLDAAITWAANSTPPPPNTPPTVSINNPLEGAVFVAPANITIDATANDPDLGGSISLVEFYQGAILLGSDNSFPYSFNWNGVAQGNYQLTAKAFDNLNASATSSIVNITVNPAATLGNILLVVGNLTLNNGDNAVKTRLETLGYSVTLKLASASAAADATGKSAVIISSTVNSTDVGNKFTNVTVPLMNCEQALHDDLKMVTVGNSGTTVNQTILNIIGAGNPLAAGLPNGLTLVYTPAQTVSWGKPGVNALKIATQSGNANNIVIFGYESNSTMVGLNAPARRLGFFLQDAGAAFFTANGTALFDAAINWLVTPPTPNNPPSVSITNPLNGAIFNAPANITINATASDPDLGGSISLVEFYQGITLLGSDNSFPYSFNWNGVAQGSYQLTAKAFDNLNASTTSSIVNITVNAVNQPPVVSITNPLNGASFTAPANVSIAATASDPDAGNTIAKVEFYVGNTLLGTDFTSPYSLNWNGVGNGTYQLKAKAFDNLNASAFSSIITITVGAVVNLPPVVSITNPLNNAVFNAPANITIDATASDPTVGGSISKVEFYQGVNLLSIDFNAPYQFIWNGVAAGSYQLTAKAFDNLNASTTSSIINITVNNPAALTALYVVGNTTLNSGDAAVKAKLESMGYTVTVVGDAASTTADANGKTIVLISATVASGNVNTKFTNVAVPVINCEPGAMDDLKLTGTASTEYGSVFNQTQINILGAGHPLAAGLPNGLTTVFNSVQTTIWGKPNGNAVSIATIAANATQVCIFGYQTGASMFGINAPARRVGFMLADATPASLNTAGMQLLEAAILWAVGTTKNEEIEAAAMSGEISIEATVYPNPSNGIFNLEVKNSLEGKLSVGIYNQFGQEVYFAEQTIDNAFYREQFDLSALPAGLYFIRVANGEMQLLRRLLKI